VTQPSFVIDTNVVVSGVLTQDASAPTAVILDAMLRGRFPFLMGPELLGEVRSVLLRPRIRALHGLSAEEVDALLTTLVALARWHEPGEAAAGAPDPGDDHLWRLLASVPGSVLVTGDDLLQRRPPPFARVLTPRAFAELLADATEP
jgi:uncharacterized protein